MSLAGGREPRKTAGNRMSKLLDAEEEDEFYKTTYGGFNDVSNPAVAMSAKLSRRLLVRICFPDNSLYEISGMNAQIGYSCSCLKVV